MSERNRWTARVFYTNPDNLATKKIMIIKKKKKKKEDVEEVSIFPFLLFE